MILSAPLPPRVFHVLKCRLTDSDVLAVANFPQSTTDAMPRFFRYGGGPEIPRKIVKFASWGEEKIETNLLLTTCYTHKDPANVRLLPRNELVANDLISFT